jgi:branched-chain amino acid transport system permease protein
MQNTDGTTAMVSNTSLLARLRSVGPSPLKFGLLILLAIVPLFVQDEYFLRLLVVALLFGAQAMCYDFTYGFINITNFGFAAFVGLGAYTSALLAVRLGVSPWLGMLAGGVSGGFLGFLTGILTLPLKPFFAACLTWFLAIGLRGATSAMVDLTRGHLGLISPLLLSGTSSRPYLYILLAITVVIYVVLRAITRSPIGLAFRAIGQDLAAAKASGVDPTKYKLINFTVSCAFAGLLGGFYAHFVGILTPDVMLTGHTLEVLTLSYAGGRGSIWGGLVAAFLIIPTFESLKSLMEIRLIIYGLLLILVMIFYPAGLAGLVHRIGDVIRKWRGGS